MDPVIYIAVAAVVILVLVVVSFLKRPAPTAEGPDRDVSAAPPPQREAVLRAGRRGGPRQRLQRRQDPDDDDDDDDEDLPDIDMPEGKVGAKKMRKLQEKAEKRAAREAELQDREERKEREKLREAQQKKEDLKREREEALLAEEEKQRKEEQEKREHEEYLKLKEAFTVDEEGTHEEELNMDTESLLAQFISYIKEMKVVMLEDLASHFRMKTQDAIERVTTLVEEGTLTGVMDDRGKFIYITQEEYEAVAKFIKQRGRVSITELAESSNNLINLQPDKDIMHKKMVSEEVEASA